MAPMPEWLNYGALGLLTLVLGAGYLLIKSILERLNEAGKFTESLAHNAIQGVQQIVTESAGAQREMAKAIDMLVKEFGKDREEAREERARLLRGQEEILRSLSDRTGA